MRFSFIYRCNVLRPLELQHKFFIKYSVDKPMLFRYFSALTASWETFEGLGMACTGLWMGFKFLQHAVAFANAFGSLFASL